MPFFNLSDLNPKNLADGVTIKAVSGEKMTMTVFYLTEGSSVPEHSHPHEQIGTVLKGTLELIIGDEKRVVTEGDGWVIPSDVVHKGHCVEGPAEVMEFFAPVREDYS
jgi:quercetin dioxygenase-like cupin family protein